MTNADRIAAALIGQEDLYGALRKVGTGLGPAEAETALPAIRAALGDAPEAARLASVDQGLLGCLLRRVIVVSPPPGRANGAGDEENHDDASHSRLLS